MYYDSNAYISAITGTSAFKGTYLLSTNDGKANWTVNARQRHRQGIKQ